MKADYMFIPEYETIISYAGRHLERVGSVVWVPGWWEIAEGSGYTALIADISCQKGEAAQQI